MSGNLLCLKNDDEFIVEYELLYLNNEGTYIPVDPRRIKNWQQIEVLTQTIAECRNKIDELNNEIDKLTNHADNLDYLLAVASGIFTGLIDIFFVGDLDMGTAKVKMNKRVNQFIEAYARSKGYKKEGLKGAIKFLEDHYQIPQDNVWKGKNIKIGTKTHHLDDLAHHPTIVGLVAAVLVQFFRCGIFVNRDGEWHIIMVDTSPEELIKIWGPVFISGILFWLVNLAKDKHHEDYGYDLPKPVIKLVNLLASSQAVLSILSVVNDWISHLVSDMGGSKNTAGGGMGIPGFFLSLLKEISGIPPLNFTELPQIVNDLYTKHKIDFRTELAAASEAGRQAVPVMLNDLIVRTFYFVRRLLHEIGSKDYDDVNWGEVNWQKVVPFNNRTIARMITIASGTFTAIDMAESGINAAIKSGGNPALFWGRFVLRINFVGIGRFAFALGSDLYMGYQRNQLITERLAVNNYLMIATKARVFYYEANMWISAEEASRAMTTSFYLMQRLFANYALTAEEFKRTGEDIDKELDNMEKSLDSKKSVDKD